MLPEMVVPVTVAVPVVVDAAAEALGAELPEIVHSVTVSVP